MNIFNCKTNHLTSPLGFAMDSATVSWVSESEVSERHIKARVLVALDQDMTQIVYDHTQSDLSCTGVKLPLSLARRKQQMPLFIFTLKNGTKKPRKPLGFWGFLTCIYFGHIMWLHRWVVAPLCSLRFARLKVDHFASQKRQPFLRRYHICSRHNNCAPQGSNRKPP